MSSFIVSQKCMNNIINGLYWNNKIKLYTERLYEEQKLEESKDFRKLANKLFKLNQKAVKQRYPDDKTDYAEITPFEWDDTNKTNIFQTLKNA